MPTIIDTLITDRTQADVDALIALLKAGNNPSADQKGSYNASDLNRVGEAINYLRGRLREIGIDSPSIDWDVAYSAESPITIQGRQAGSGTPSISNVRPIFFGLYLPSTGRIYSGTLNTETGELSADKIGMVFTGQENWAKVNAGSGGAQYYRLKLNNAVTASSGACSHYDVKSVTSTNTTVGWRVYTSSSTPYLAVRPDLTIYATVDAWKAGLKGLYLAGTPVTAWWSLSSNLTATLGEAEIAYSIRALGTESAALKASAEAVTDWDDSDIPTIGEMNDYIQSIIRLWMRTVEYLPGATIPDSMRHLDYNGANDIEKLLAGINDMIDRIELSYRNYSGRLVSGVNCLP